MPGRVTGSFAAAALLLAGLAPGATAAHAPELAGRTHVVASGTSKMRIYVRHGTQIAMDPAKSFHVSGPGRLVGLILRENHPKSPDELGFLRLPAKLYYNESRIYRWGPRAENPGCTSNLPKPLPPVGGGGDCTYDTTPTHFTLRRGNYTLYVLTDGGPVRMTLRAANLRGERTLTPRVGVAQATAPMTTTLTQPVAWAGGASIRATGPAAVFAYVQWRNDESSATGVGACWYDSAEDRAHAFAPGCPAGSEVSSTEVRHLYRPRDPATRGPQTMLSVGEVTEAGPYAVGGWVTARSVRDASGFVYWVGR